MENFENIFKTICRTCLSYGKSENMVCLTDNAASDGLSPYGKSLLSFTNITAINDYLPDKMCAKCSLDLSQAVKFRNKCENSNKKLSKFMENLDILDTKPTDFQEKLCEYMLFMDNKDEFPNEEAHEYWPEEITKESCSYVTSKDEEIKEEVKIEYHSDNKCDDSNNFGNNSLHDTDEEWNSRPSSLEDPFLEMLEQGTSQTDIRPKRKAARKTVFVEESDSESDESIDIKYQPGNESQTLNLAEQIRLRKLRKKQKKRSFFAHHSETDSDERKDKEYRPGNDSHTSESSDEDLRTQKSKTKFFKKPEYKQCHICKKSIVDYNLTIHMKRHNKNNRNCICDQCGNKFFSLVELRRHQRVHGISTWVCKKCGFKASCKPVLIEHNRLHTGERPFKCNKCEMTFSRKLVYKKHCKLHLEKTEQCPWCPKKFHTRQTMLVHFNGIHHRLYMYACNRCDVTYASDLTIRKHLTNVHGVPKEKHGKIKRIELGIPQEIKDILKWKPRV